MFQRPAQMALANRRIPAARVIIVAAVLGVAALAAGVELTLSAGGGAARRPASASADQASPAGRPVAAVRRAR